MKKATLPLLVFMWLSLPVVGMAGEVGRYQIVVVPASAQTANRPVVFILDTKEGHIWEKLLVEKPSFYCGQVKAPDEKGLGFWQIIGGYLFGEKALAPQTKEKGDPLGIREKEEEFKPLRIRERGKPATDYSYNPQTGKLEKVDKLITREQLIEELKQRGFLE